MKVGVSGFLPAWQLITPADLKRVRDTGLSGAVLRVDAPLQTAIADVHRVKQLFADAGVAVCQMNGAYENLIDPDDALRASGIAGLQALIRFGVAVGAPSTYVRPGSLNPVGQWWPHRDNHAPRTFDRLVQSMRTLCTFAEQEGAILAIEGHVVSTLDSPRRVKDLFDAVASPALMFNFDPVNFIGTVSDVHNTARVLNELCDVLGHRFVAAHAKDVTILDAHVVQIVETQPCTGTLDHYLFMKRFNKICPTGWFIIEHLPDDRVPPARAAWGVVASALEISLE